MTRVEACFDCPVSSTVVMYQQRDNGLVCFPILSLDTFHTHTKTVIVKFLRVGEHRIRNLKKHMRHKFRPVSTFVRHDLFLPYVAIVVVLLLLLLLLLLFHVFFVVDFLFFLFYFSNFLSFYLSCISLSWGLCAAGYVEHRLI